MQRDGKSKILFSDLDGTLLNDNKTISDTNRDAIQEMLDRGHYFTICTGRAVESGRIVAKELGLNRPGCYMICYNGAVIYDCASDRIIQQKRLRIEDVIRLFQAAEKSGIHVQTYQGNDVIALEHTKELDYYIEKSKMTFKVKSDLISAIESEPHKVLLTDIDKTGKLQQFQKENEKWTQNTMNSFFSCEEYLEYCPKDVTKATGIKVLCDMLNIPIKNTVAVGDERNDIPMIVAAGCGIAMANAYQDVLFVADAITENDNNNDAIAEVIEKYIFNDAKIGANA